MSGAGSALPRCSSRCNSSRAWVAILLAARGRAPPRVAGPRTRERRRESAPLSGPGDIVKVFTEFPWPRHARLDSWQAEHNARVRPAPCRGGARSARGSRRRAGLTPERAPQESPCRSGRFPPALRHRAPESDDRPEWFRLVACRPRHADDSGGLVSRFGPDRPGRRFLNRTHRSLHATRGTLPWTLASRRRRAAGCHFPPGGGPPPRGGRGPGSPPSRSSPAG